MESLKQREHRNGYESENSDEIKYKKHLAWLSNYKKQHLEDYGREPEEEDIERICRNTYVNTYETDKAFGGREEGGWWYDFGYPVESVHFEYRYEAEEAFPQIEAKWQHLNEVEDRRDPGSTLCDGYYKTWFDDKFGEAFPKSKPTYE
tara:strand:- start:133 stop:576 length:444 start_codon:yes stop_codon:yes gene_type:complete